MHIATILSIPTTLTLSLAVLVLSGCTHDDRTSHDEAELNRATSDQAKVTEDSSHDTRAVDNSGQNAADRNSGSVTPLDQGNSASDVTITRDIRRLVTDEKNLSINGRNVKIITRDGAVTLRGPVESFDER
ncbi:hypothetical protein LBMAG53_31360 [Planctomycetota bacterium]|nr:hypothetical protein LBMAG53_31360 [Planctomycetota bacterium]